MVNSLKKGLVNRLKWIGAYDVRIADPRVGFEPLLPGRLPPEVWKPLPVERFYRHPLDLWKECRSIVVFAVACSPKVNNLYLGLYAPWKSAERKLGPVPSYIQSDDYAMDRLVRIFIKSITLEGMAFLRRHGCDVSFEYYGFNMPGIKMAAYEAGIGVYGRAGFIIHPVLGSRIRLGAIMTNAELEPDGRLEGFNPCEDCDLCIKACPAKAFDPTKQYPYSYDRAKCMAKRAEIAKKGFYCHNCYAVCPAGQLKDEELLSIKEARSIYKSMTTSKN